MKTQSNFRIAASLTLAIIFIMMMFPEGAEGQFRPPVRRNKPKPPDSGLFRGVNFGNMLEAPNEGDWGLFVQSIFFDRVAEAGFDHIRMPISWTTHADQFAPYTIDEDFFQRVDWCVDQALSRGLKIIVNVHHYGELNDDPVAEWTRALAIWEQIADRYQNEPAEVYFEILNEPHGEFNNQPVLWDMFMVDALAVIRQNNPTRKVLAGPVYWNNVGQLGNFILPDDPNMVGTFHYYSPFEFTHQGAEWVNPSPPVGTPWDPRQYTLNDNWQSWSWDITEEKTNDGMEITYNGGWAGYRLHHTQSGVNATQLSFAVDSAMTLLINCRDADGNGNQVSLQTSAGWNTYTFDISQFGNIGPVTDVFIQNGTANAAPTFTIKDFKLTSGSTEWPLLITSLDAVKASIESARIWGRLNQRPIYMGEFGAYDKADMPSRVLWTNSVRRASQQSGIGFGYWEFGAGFGIYDPSNDAWRLDLLRTLIPEF